MKRLPIVLALGLLICGCSKDKAEESAVHFSDEKFKPVVAIVPLINSTTATLSWDLSEELTESLYQRLTRGEKLHLTGKDKIHSAVKKFKASYNPFGPDLSWVKPAFPGQQFIVFLELIEHEELSVSYSKKEIAMEDSSAQFNMSVRVRVLDLRQEMPKVVLQEMIHDSHFIPKPFNRFNFYQVAWGDQGFSISPMGLAHASLTKEIASRLEDYILLAKAQ